MASNQEQTRTCLQCGRELQGRKDKKFCDDQCRNDFNNQRNAHESEEVRSIINILKKNRKILADLISPEGKSKVTKNTMAKNGFDFHFFTHTYTTQNNSTYRYCFEFGYLPLEGDYFLIVKREKKAITTENLTAKG